ncbi:helix-turn-helix transcriptional regulator [Moellerella wisconsensis]|uniref:helix-turn-helix transcriptional regulator n=1 Tax=Moellerella wisconsensis TaxID=158849 RepID=UPI0030762969
MKHTQQVQLTCHQIDEPQLIACRQESIDKTTEFSSHTHPFGQLLYVVCGIMEMVVEGQHYIAPPEFCIWIPAQTEHSSYNKSSVNFQIIDFNHQLSGQFPAYTCVIRLSPIFRAIMTDLYSRKVVEPESPEDRRLAQVLIDQLKYLPAEDSYLPGTKDKLLAPILSALQHDPANNDSLACWAKRGYTSERTLSRRCQQALGMSFSEWRQRLRYLHAVAGLTQGKTIHQVALDVGYSSSSAFITMFQQISGLTPERFRNKDKLNSN